MHRWIVPPLLCINFTTFSSMSPAHCGASNIQLRMLVVLRQRRISSWWSPAGRRVGWDAAGWRVDPPSCVACSSPRAQRCRRTSLIARRRATRRASVHTCHAPRRRHCANTCQRRALKRYNARRVSRQSTLKWYQLASDDDTKQRSNDLYIIIY